MMSHLDGNPSSVSTIGKIAVTGNFGDSLGDKNLIDQQEDGISKSQVRKKEDVWLHQD